MTGSESEMPRHNGRVCSKILLDNSSMQRIVYLHTVYVTSQKSDSGLWTTMADKKLYTGKLKTQKEEKYFHPKIHKVVKILWLSGYLITLSGFLKYLKKLSNILLFFPYCQENYG